QVAPPPVESLAASGGARYEPIDPIPEPQRAPALLDALKNSRQWFQRHMAPGAQDVAVRREDASPLDDDEEANPAERPSAEAEPGDPLHPTQVLLSHSLEVPPYKTQAHVEPESVSEEREEELEFDGWEDVPRALGDGRAEPSLRIVYQSLPATRGGVGEPVEAANTVGALPPFL